MSGARGADQSHRPRLPRQAKLSSQPLRSSRPTRSTTAAAITAAATGSDDDDGNDSTPHRRHRRSVHPKTPSKRSFVNDDDATVTTKRPRRSPRGSKSKISYTEPDTDLDLETGPDADDYDDDDDDDDDDNDNSGAFHPKVKVANAPFHRRNTRSSHGVTNARKQRKSSPRNATIKKQKQVNDSQNDQHHLSYPGNALPYLAWLRIFEFLASPLLDPDARTEDIVFATRKLLKAAFLGKLVYEPAMAALYKRPPIFDQAGFRLLSRTLRQPPNTTMIQYRPKVEILRIDVNDILSFKYDRVYSVLDDMVPYLPRLVDLELYHFLDRPPYRSLDAHIRYKYPENLLQVFHLTSDASDEALASPVPIELQSWRWNARFASDAFPLEKLAMIHQKPYFTSLRKVAFVNYQLPSCAHPRRTLQSPEVEDAAATSNVAAAIKALPQLEHLVFESSTLVDFNLLRLLPKGLKHLELINCWEVTADSLAEFLHTHGNSLERLTLKHCISLSLGFLRVLNVACPNLTDLHINLLYYKTHEHYHDADPLYERILKDDEIPQWPSSLQSIEIGYMKFDSVVTAEMFFKSLVASAPALPNLRRLVLGAKMDVSYRERREFRKTLETRISDVFQRRSKSPRSIRSLGDGELYGLGPGRHNPGDDPLPPSVDQNPGRVRPNTRRTVHSSPTSDYEGSNVAPQQKLASQLQWSMRDIPTRRSPATDEDSVDEELTAHYRGLLKLDDDDDFVHGLCDVVQVELDNQKPTEHKWVMDDFLDSPSGEDSDTDWNEDDSMAD